MIIAYVVIAGTAYWWFLIQERGLPNSLGVAAVLAIWCGATGWIAIPALILARLAGGRP